MKQRELLMLSIVVFFTIISWLIIDIYNVSKDNTIDSENKIEMPKEIKMKIDTSVFESLRNKK